MELFKFEARKPDGRNWIQYSRTPFPEDFSLEDPGLIRPTTWTPPFLRYNQMRDEWTCYSASRQDRPMLPPKEYCPLCPFTVQPTADAGAQTFKTEVPITGRLYEWAVFENMFPALSTQGETPTGLCEVILYSPSHESTLGDESVAHIEGLMHVWQDRSRCLGQRPGLEYIFIFENKGPEIGVTLHHPHGQLYAFNHVPPFIEREHAAARHHHKLHHTCLVCSMAGAELADRRRIVLESDSLVAYVPLAARYPYEVHLTTKMHRPLIENLTASECSELALMLKRLVHKFDALFGFKLPYIMVHHQAAAKNPGDPTYHWHLEFYPPYRSANKLKYLAGVESGTGFFVNDTIPEEKALELRNAACPF